MIDPIKISLVSYFNSKPFLHGIQQSSFSHNIELSLDIPAQSAQKLLNKTVQIGLVPVAILHEMSDFHIISDYCIGALDSVKTVAIFSEVPLEKIKTIYLDHQSKTSVALCKFLLKAHWKLSPELLYPEKEFIHQIKGENAGLVIGDRTIGLEKKYPYVYDLASAWKTFSGLPFVFACWVSNIALPPEFLEEFNKALAFGVDQKLLVAEENKSATVLDLKSYYTDYIHFFLDDELRSGMKLFLEMAFSEHSIK